MRQVLESDIEADFRHFSVAGEDLLPGCLQSAADEPFLGREITYFPEIPLECGEAASGVVGYFPGSEVIHVVLFHELQYVRLPRVGKVEERGVEALVRVQQHVDAFGHFQVEQFLRGLDAGVEIGGHRLEQAYDVGPAGRQLQQADLVPSGLFGQSALVQPVVEIPQKPGGEHQEYGLELLSFPGLLGQLYSEILADEGTVPPCAAG